MEAIEAKSYALLKKDTQIKHIEKGTQKSLVNHLFEDGWILVGEITIAGEIGLGGFLELHDMRLKSKINEFENIIKSIDHLCGLSANI